LKSSDNPVRRLRDFLKLNQIDFGRLIGKSSATIRSYEGGHTIPTEVRGRLRTLAAEKGLVDIAMELSGDDDWQVRTVIYPFKPGAPEASSPASPDRDRLQLLFDATLADPSFGPALMALLYAFEQSKIVSEPQTRKVGDK